MKLTLGLVVVVALLSGCITFSDQPTQKMVDAQLRKTKKIVSFSSALSPLTIEDKTLKSGCGPGSQTVSSLVMPGPGMYVPVISKAEFSVDHGSWPNGSRWIALRMDSAAHAVPSGMRLTQRADGGSDVDVLAADARKVDLIKQRAEEGTLFCHWREFDYPYD